MPDCRIIYVVEEPIQLPQVFKPRSKSTVQCGTGGFTDWGSTLIPHIRLILIWRRNENEISIWDSGTVDPRSCKRSHHNSSSVLHVSQMILFSEWFMWWRFKFKLWMFVQDTFSIRAIWLYDNRVISVGGPSPFGTLALGLPQARLPPQIMILFAKRWSRTI